MRSTDLRQVPHTLTGGRWRCRMCGYSHQPGMYTVDHEILERERVCVCVCVCVSVSKHSTNPTQHPLLVLEEYVHILICLWSDKITEHGVFVAGKHQQCTEQELAECCSYYTLFLPFVFIWQHQGAYIRIVS